MEGTPRVGEIVCTCRMVHVKIIEVNGDDIVTEDGWRCSYYHCCDEPGHTWTHEEVTAAARARDRHKDLT